MPVDINAVFERGGRELLDLLEYSVLSLNKEVVFLYLAREYRQHPTARMAVALHDMFCAAQSPARIDLAVLLPPKDMRLEQAISGLRPVPPVRPAPPAEDGAALEDAAAVEDSEALEAEEPPRPPPPVLPPRYLFDAVVEQLTAGPETVVARVAQHYDPSLTPHENLPGGKLQAGQRAFVENIWLPIVRPHLVAAGFWRVATVA
ncbi:MAG: hypothetical protein KDA45_01805 [Planctomycetales bacterium]|nr:hypothetical protein [Planctomycetales bacterium]